MDDRDWGTLTKKQVEVLREFLQRFIEICPDADNKIDPGDRKRIAAVKKILNSMTDISYRRSRWVLRLCFPSNSEVLSPKPLDLLTWEQPNRHQQPN
jgi:hypothetical protein